MATSSGQVRKEKRLEYKFTSSEIILTPKTG